MKLHQVGLFVLLLGCGSGAKEGEGPKSGDGATSGDGTSAGDTGAESGDKGAPSTEATAEAAAGPKEPESTKDSNALVLELTVSGKGDLDDKGKKAIETEAAGWIRKSSKLASPGSKVKEPREVLANLTVEPATEDKKKGLTVKLSITGVAKNGNCPLFDLEQKMSMSDGKKTNADDVAELRKAALNALFQELEGKAPTLKPNANCTPFK